MLVKQNHSLGGGGCHMDSTGGCRVGGLHPWLVGHLLRPGPRLSRELAGGPLCHRTALEQSLRASTHRPVGGAAEGPLLLAWAPYYCPTIVLHRLQSLVPRQAGPTMTPAPPAPPISSSATSARVKKKNVCEWPAGGAGGPAQWQLPAPQAERPPWVTQKPSLQHTHPVGPSLCL